MLRATTRFHGGSPSKLTVPSEPINTVLHPAPLGLPLGMPPARPLRLDLRPKAHDAEHLDLGLCRPPAADLGAHRRLVLWSAHDDDGLRLDRAFVAIALAVVPLGLGKGAIAASRRGRRFQLLVRDIETRVTHSKPPWIGRDRRHVAVLP